MSNNFENKSQHKRNDELETLYGMLPNIEPVTIEFKYEEMGQDSQKTYDYFTPTISQPRIIFVHHNLPPPTYDQYGDTTYSQNQNYGGYRLRLSDPDTARVENAPLDADEKKMIKKALKKEKKGKQVGKAKKTGWCGCFK